MGSKSMNKHAGSLETLSKTDSVNASKALRINAEMLFATAKDASSTLIKKQPPILEGCFFICYSSATILQA